MSLEELENIENTEESMDDDHIAPDGEVASDDELHTVVHLSGMYQEWFLDYASYVILERAVPHLHDGLKPVQRRILHSMKRLDDGRYNKVANIIGHYHAIPSSRGCFHRGCPGSIGTKRPVGGYAGELGKYPDRRRGGRPQVH
jgi:hypothetical protein